MRPLAIIRAGQTQSLTDIRAGQIRSPAVIRSGSRRSPAVISAIPMIALLSLAVLTSGCRGRKDAMDLEALIPAGVAGWTAGDVTPYDTQTIFEYMDGAGELFLSYAYRGMLVRRFERDGNELTAEIYDMGVPADAYGIFSRFRSGESLDIGSGACSVRDHLNFWKGRFFVSIFALADEAGVRDEIFALGRTVADRIAEEAPLPGLVQRLPSENRDPDSVRFFHRHTDLNRYYFVSDTNILALDETTDAALAAYERGEEYSFLLLVRYADTDLASRVAAAFRAAWMPEAGSDGIVQVEDGRWSAVAVQGEVLGADPREVGPVDALRDLVAPLSE